MNGDMKNIGMAMMAKAMQECPSAGKTGQRPSSLRIGPRGEPRALMLLNKCEHSPHVLLAVAK